MISENSGDIVLTNGEYLSKYSSEIIKKGLCLAKQITKKHYNNDLQEKHFHDIHKHKNEDLGQLLDDVHPFVFLYNQHERYKDYLKDDTAAYEIGVYSGKKIWEEEYFPTLRRGTQGIKLHGYEFIESLKVDMEKLIYIYDHTNYETRPETYFISPRYLEIHFRTAVRLIAYYTVLQLCLRHPNISSEKLIGRFGKDFYQSLIKLIDQVIEYNQVRWIIERKKIFEFIEDLSKQLK
jgi:hypothetical protein